MRYQQLPSDDLVERVLAGKQSGEGLDDVAAAMATLRHMHSDRGFRMGAELSALLVSGLANEKGDLSATAASNAHGPAPQESGLPNWTQRRKRMLHVLLGTLAGKVAAATVAAATVVGGLGAANALPDSVQGAVADAAEVVRIDLPSPHDDDEATVVDDADDAADGDDLTEVHDADDDADEADDGAVAGVHDASDDADETDDDADETDADDDADESDDDDADEVRSRPSSPATTPTSVTARNSDHDEQEADHSDDRSGSSSSASSGSGTDHDTEDDPEDETAGD